MASFSDMPAVDWILHNDRFCGELARLKSFERGRVFCHHDMAHLLDVARIMWIATLERGLGFERELVYATALLHDVGKATQYETGEPHDAAGVRIAGEILRRMPTELAFSEEDTVRILMAIAGHRKLRANAEPLEALLFEADKASRACYACAAREQCNWSQEKMNLTLRV